MGCGAVIVQSYQVSVAHIPVEFHHCLYDKKIRDTPAIDLLRQSCGIQNRLGCMAGFPGMLLIITGSVVCCVSGLVISAVSSSTNSFGLPSDACPMTAAL